MKNFVQKGERITIVADSLVGPNDPIKSGDPVVVGRLVGVANADEVMPTQTADPTNDVIVVQTVGVFTLAVKSLHHNITIGSTVYINASTALVSDDYTAVPFGVVLDQVNQYATTVVRVRLFGATPGAIGADS
jgi:predicted RecA/RadA family phage recombinase